MTVGDVGYLVFLLDGYWKGLVTRREYLERERLHFWIAWETSIR